jgi:CDP-diacylglycerol--glycerol-3-phosphate 3-phosphatidyltransferase
MNIPNLLTLLRIFFVPMVVAALVMEKRTFHPGFPLPNTVLALAIFIAAALTDLLDGYLARRWGQITTVGTLLDPIADKLLVSAALISLVQVRVVEGWIVVLIVGREFAISGLRSIAAAEGYTIQASDLGKTKMLSQVAAVCLLMLSIQYPTLEPAAQMVMWIVVFFSLASAVAYFRKFWHTVDVQVKKRRRRELLRLEKRRKLAARRSGVEITPGLRASGARSDTLPD